MHVTNKILTPKEFDEFVDRIVAGGRVHSDEQFNDGILEAVEAIEDAPAGPTRDALAAEARAKYVGFWENPTYPFHR